MEIKLKTTSREVIASGTVVVPYGEFLEFVIAGLTFRLLFEEDKEDPKSYFLHGVEDEGGKSVMAIHAYNFKDALLNSVREPLNLGKIEGRPLSLHLAISSANKKEVEIEGVKNTQCNMLVYYTWYLTDIPNGLPSQSSKS